MPINQSETVPPENGNTEIKQEKSTMAAPRAVPPYRQLVHLAKARAEQQLDDMRTLINPDTERLARELQIFAAIVRATIDPDVVEFDPSIPAAIAFDTVDHEKRGYQLILCSDLEAKAIFDHASPGLPILIPAQRFTRPVTQLDLPRYLDVLATKDQVELHQYGKHTRPADDSEFVAPDPLTGDESMNIFRSPSRMPVNCLNLDIHKPNPQPWFLSDSENY